MTPPHALSEPVVELPEAAELGSAGEEVPLVLVVEADGMVSQVTVLESKGEVLDGAARQAARRMRFAPAEQDGKPVRARVRFLMPLGGERVVLESVEPVAEPVAVADPLTTVENEVVVTGARTPEKRATSVISTQVITREDARLSGATTLAGALDAQPGLQIERTFRGTELWIRGLDPEYTLVLIDGQRVPGRVGGAIDLNRYPLESVERVEIVRGPSSALYGSDAIGGVVNVITRETKRDLEADAEARIGTNDAVAASARVGGRPLPWLGVTLSAGHQYTGAFRRDPEATATTGSENRLDSVGGRFAFGAARDNRVVLQLDYTQNRLDGVDAGAGGALFDRTQLQEQAQISLGHTLERGAMRVQTNAFYSQFREQYLNDQRGSTALDSYQDNREHLGQAGSTLSYAWNQRQRTTFGGELMSQLLDSDRLESTGYRVRYSGFLEHRATLLANAEREIFSVVPGARVDVDSQFGSQLSPKLALRWDPEQHWTFRAGYGRGFRAPSFQELLLRFENPAVGYIVSGNPELTAESSQSVDVSAEYRPSRHWFFSTAAFRNDLTDMISTVTVSQPGVPGLLFSYENIDKARTQGLESMGIWSPSQLLALTLSYTLTETRNEALDRPLQGRPLHRFLFRVVSTHEPTGITASARGSLSLDRFYFVDNADGSTSQVTGDPLVQIDLRLAKSFTENFELFVGVNNLADAGDAFAVLLPRQFYAGLRGNY